MEEVFNTIIKEAEEFAEDTMKAFDNFPYKDCFPYETGKRIKKDNKEYRIKIIVELAN